MQVVSLHVYIIVLDVQVHVKMNVKVIHNKGVVNVLLHVKKAVELIAEWLVLISVQLLVMQDVVVDA